MYLSAVLWLFKYLYALTIKVLKYTNVYNPLSSYNLNFISHFNQFIFITQFQDLKPKLCSCWKKLSEFHKFSDFTILKCSQCKNENCPNKRQYEAIKDIKVAYAIQTSGTTGEAKVVQVPHDCIISNIIDLR